MFNFLILTSYQTFDLDVLYTRVIVSFICVSITNISSFQAHEVVQAIEIEPDKKSDLVPSVAPEPPRMTKPKQELSATPKAEPSKKQEPALVPAKKHEVQKTDVFKIPELTPASRELVEDQLAKEPEPTPVTVFKKGPKAIFPEAPKVEQGLTQSHPEQPLAKPIQEKEQASLPKQKSPPKRGIISKPLT